MCQLNTWEEMDTLKLVFLASPLVLPGEWDAGSPACLPPGCFQGGEWVQEAPEVQPFMSWLWVLGRLRWGGW